MDKILKFAKDVSPVVALALIMRIIIDSIQIFANSGIGHFFVVFGPPAVGIVALVGVILPISKYTRTIVVIGRFALLPVMINAGWRILEYLTTYNSCLSPSGGFHESFCLTLAIQLWVHIPFLIVSALVLLVFLVGKKQYLPVPGLA